MIETTESTLPLGTTSLETALAWSKLEYPCSYLLVVSEAQAGSALRLASIFPRITVSCDSLNGTEWKLACLTPTLKIKLWHSTGTG